VEGEREHVEIKVPLPARLLGLAECIPKYDRPLACRVDTDDDQDGLELTLDLLADVPAGKLVVSEARIDSHAQVLALERAGGDAILGHGLAGPPDFAAILQGLRPGP